LQKAASGGLDRPQLLHECANRVPQPLQKAASAVFSRSQEGQRKWASGPDVRAVYHPRAGARLRLGVTLRVRMRTRPPESHS
jgi:hypothetical protein